MEIGDPRPEDPTWRTGSIYPFAASSSANTREPGDWNRYELTCIEHTYTVRINGRVVTRWTDPKRRSASGHLGLQNYKTTPRPSPPPQPHRPRTPMNPTPAFPSPTPSHDATTRGLGRRQFLRETVAVTTALGAARPPSSPPMPRRKRPPRSPRTEDPRRPDRLRQRVSGSYLPHLTPTTVHRRRQRLRHHPVPGGNRAKQFKVPHVYPDIDSMLGGEPFELLVNTTSMPSHFPVNARALKAGRHVWSEKPMALSLRDARHLMDLARRNDRQIWAAPACVTSPQFRFMAETIAAGKIGRPTAAHGVYGHGGVSWSLSKRAAAASTTSASTTSPPSPGCSDPPAKWSA